MTSSGINASVGFYVHISPSFVHIVVFVSVYSTWWSLFASRLEWRRRHGLGYISWHISGFFGLIMPLLAIMLGVCKHDIS